MIFLIILTLFSQVLADVEVDSLPISASFQPLEQGSNIVNRDSARLRALSTRHEKRAKGVRLKNIGLSYLLNVGFGSPPTYYMLQVDTGSPYTWVREEKYVKTRTSIKQGNQEFSIKYLRGAVSGAHYTDLVTLSPSLSIPNMEFGVTSHIVDIHSSFDGILGLAPASLTRYLVWPNNGKSVPTTMDGLLAQKKVQHNVFGLSFAPTTSKGLVDGRLSLGGTDRKKYTGRLNWVGITKPETWNEPGYWDFKQTIKYGKQPLQTSSVGGIDSGITLIYITLQAFEVYAKSLPGSKIDESSRLLEIPKESLDKMKSLFFIINEVSYEFTPNAQLWPRAFNSLLGGKEGRYYSVINTLPIIGAPTEPEFIIGYVFMQRFYTAYDASNFRIGFATTRSTYAVVD